ncbi:MAG: elongation factor P [SAR202 cluster bacterium]|nr:elongation factor P [SAR202 cluster bacterium]
MTINAGELRKGMAIVLDGEPYQVVEFERQKMQQRAPTTRVRFRSLRTGKVVDKSYSGFDVKLSPAQVDRHDAQYIYNDGDMYYFMDEKTFEQFPLNQDQVGAAVNYLIEQTTVQLVFFNGQPITIDLPITVDLKVAETEPGFKGDTATGGNKPATLETGLLVQVPLFVSTGDTIRVDTRTGEYVARV